MSVIKDVAKEEAVRLSSGIRNELHLYQEGSFLRAYNWSAWLACRFLNEFKVNKRQFKDVGDAVAFIGFPEKSLDKWLPEGVEQTAVAEKHLVLRLPDVLLGNDPDSLMNDYNTWMESIPLTATKEASKKNTSGVERAKSSAGAETLTAIMQQILAWPVENRSPLESMTFLADVKVRLAALI